MKRWLVGCMLVLLAGWSAPGGADEAAPKIPELRVTTIEGQAFDLAQQRGRWVVVNYWATWCGPCLREMPEFDAFSRSRSDVTVLGLAYEEIDAEALRAFLVEHPVSYPIAIVDVFSPPADFPAPRGLPMTWLIGPDGSVARRFLGPVDADDLAQAMAAAGGDS